MANKLTNNTDIEFKISVAGRTGKLLFVVLKKVKSQDYPSSNFVWQKLQGCSWSDPTRITNFNQA